MQLESMQQKKVHLLMAKILDVTGPLPIHSVTFRRTICIVKSEHYLSENLFKHGENAFLLLCV
ncbi:hypothetical protein DVA81_19790, partial [Acinetobacter baumannii]